VQRNILENTPEELAAWLAQKGEKPFHLDQILRWLYQRQVQSFALMTDISKALRAKLAEDFAIERLNLEETLTGSDGAKKFLFGLADGQFVESVLLPERGHFTLCVSSQVGCAMGCAFCRTGQDGFTRNLTQAEIVSQVRDTAFALEKPESLTNLVFMGMGEPLANYENLIRALDILTDNDWGMRFSGRRVTVSTAGLVPKIPSLGKDSRVKLAVSLNAADDDTRDAIMPINRKWPIKELLAACRAFPLKASRRVTFEFVLLKGVNDSVAHAKKLAALLGGFSCKINLIAFNPHAESAFERPDPQAVLAFQEVLLDKNFTVIIRDSKGADIAAACGQLRARHRADQGK
jgi:23S rRNA (adenine2503-C2)-methyltransferase